MLYRTVGITPKIIAHVYKEYQLKNVYLQNL